MDEPKPFGKAEALFEYGTNVFLNPVTHSNQLSCKERIHHAALLVLVLIHPHQSGTPCRGKKGESLLWTKTWKMQRIPRLILRAGVVVGGADNAVHHGAIVLLSSSKK